MRLGEALVICPGCGESFTVPVKLSKIHTGRSGLWVFFADEYVDHECKGVGG